MCKLILAVLAGVLVYLGLVSQQTSDGNANFLDNLVGKHNAFGNYVNRNLFDHHNLSSDLYGNKRQVLTIQSFNLVSTWLDSNSSSTPEPPLNQEVSTWLDSNSSSTPEPPLNQEVSTWLDSNSLSTPKPPLNQEVPTAQLPHLEDLLQKLLWPVLTQEPVAKQQESLKTRKVHFPRDDKPSTVSATRLTPIVPVHGSTNPVASFVKNAVARLHNQGLKTLNSIQNQIESMETTSQSKFDTQIQQVLKQMVELNGERDDELQQQIEQLEVEMKANQTKDDDDDVRQHQSKSKRYWQNYDDIRLKYDFNLYY